uniref:Putative secreted peptide n=1 Tax=Anopheles braziliensis TaxID=58242 RepID=A0A2M3ZTH1_9DIPT
MPRFQIHVLTLVLKGSLCLVPNLPPRPSSIHNIFIRPFTTHFTLTTHRSAQSSHMCYLPSALRCKDDNRTKHTNNHTTHKESRL